MMNALTTENIKNKVNKKPEKIGIPYLIGYHMNEVMKKEFIITKAFDREWKDFGLNDDDLRRLQNEIMQNPEAAVMMEGTGGLQKRRFAFEGRGKRGSLRVCYVDFVIYEKVFLIAVFAQSEKENLTKEEKQQIKKVITAIKNQLSKEDHNV